MVTEDADSILVDRADNGVVTVTLNRPRVKNAVTGPMWDELRRIFREVTSTASDRVLVITGAAGAFCAGADLSGDTMARNHPLNAMHAVSGAAMALHEVAKPTIAKIDGDAVGGGLNLALGCDLIVASDRSRFSEIFVHRGLSLDIGGTWLLPRLIGMHRAKELALLGELVSAAEAERIGLVNRVLPPAELDAFVADWADRLAAGPPIALQMTKRMLSNALSISLSEALAAEDLSQTVNFASQDTREGVTAFLEKRAPKFTGR